MSTYWYLQCTDHTPPLWSADEVEQHTSGLGVVRKLCARRDEITPENMNNLEGYFERNAARFLIQHPTCHLRLVNEYGDYESLEISK